MATLANPHVRRRHREHRLPASGSASIWATPRPVYLPRRATQTPLYPVVQHHLETFLAQAAEADTLGEGVPSWVERDFRGYLECGILAYGFARARCEECGHERLIPFSCKGRGVCPSCNARRMCEVAAHLTDHVLPRLPARQWVLSVPTRVRPLPAARHARSAPRSGSSCGRSAPRSVARVQARPRAPNPDPLSLPTPPPPPHIEAAPSAAPVRVELSPSHSSPPSPFPSQPLFAPTNTASYLASSGSRAFECPIPTPGPRRFEFSTA